MIVWIDRRLGVAALVSLVFARTVGGRLPHVLFYLTTAYLLMAYVWLRYSLSNLSCLYQVERKAASTGEQVPVKLRLYNEGLLPIPWVEAQDLSPVSEGVPPVTASLPALRSAVIAYHVRPSRRGRYDLGPVRVRLSDPAGTFALQAYYPVRGTLVIYPRPVAIEWFPLAAMQPYGHASRQEHALEDRTSIASLKEFAQGDSPKHIHWKVTARQGKPMVKQFHLVAGADVYVLLDLYSRHIPGVSPAPGEPEPLWTDRVVEAGVSVADYALRRGHQVAAWCCGMRRYRVPPGRGAQQLGQVLQMAAEARSGPGIDLPAMLLTEQSAIHPRATVVVVGRRLDQQAVASMLRLTAASHPVVFIHTQEGLADSLPQDTSPPCSSPSTVSLPAARLGASNIQIIEVRPGESLVAALGLVARVSSNA